MAAFDVLTPPNPEFRQLVKGIDIPSLLVMGDTGVVSPAVAEELQLLNPRFQIQLIQKAGHGLQYDQPEKFAAVVKAFLSSLVL
jgi:pimeloyl-ACP methyl ester carboxylesterase